MHVELTVSMPCEKLKMIVVRTRRKEDRNDGKPANSLLVSLVALQYSVMSPVLGRPRHNTVCSPLLLLPRGPAAQRSIYKSSLISFTGEQCQHNKGKKKPTL